MTATPLNPLVSMGMPVFNGTGKMARAVDSLLAQTYANFELVISDNCSTDGTWDLCQEYARRDNRVRISRNHENIGIVPNFKRVLALASGKYFMWTAVDDFWKPHFVETLVREMEGHPETGIALCAFELVRPDHSPHKTYNLPLKHRPNGRGRLATALSCYTPAKMNYYMYGLFQREFVLGQIDHLAAMNAADRRFVTKLALLKPLRYVDQALHVRTNNTSIPIQKRYPGDSSVKPLANRSSAVINIRPFTTVAGFVLHCRHIPLIRKALYLPPLFLWYSAYQFSLIHLRLRQGLQRLRQSLFSRGNGSRRVAAGNMSNENGHGSSSVGGDAPCTQRQGRTPCR
ncbi:MAG: glycosyltransferase family 2 protein [Desulfovibrio sp.]|nr:MAG: glycosyltransferase family 2 protein [Desulfovibrio sp.]